MRNKIVLIVLPVIMLVISSCSNLIFFTQEIRDDLNENNLDVEKVQFYNSEKITLKRNLSKEETQIAKGTIRLENGEYFEEIIIPKKTKGVAIIKGTEFLKVAFETGDKRNIRFDINDDMNYQISADSWNDNFGCIVYDTNTYLIVPGSSNTLLMVNKEYISNFEMKRRVLKGRSVAR
jgi:hypothetical protein